MDNNILNMMQQGESAFQNGKIVEALEIFNSVIEKDPDNIFALNDKGVVLNSIGRYNEAINTFLHILNTLYQATRLSHACVSELAHTERRNSITNARGMISDEKYLCEYLPVELFPPTI